MKTERGAEAQEEEVVDMDMAIYLKEGKNEDYRDPPY